MTVLICMRGYPASGKSTLARSLAEDGKAIVVNRDALREMAYGVRWGDPIEERVITYLENACVGALLRHQKNAIIDNTHLEGRHLARWQALAMRLDVQFEVVDVPTSANVCVQRDRQRENPVGADLIWRMSKDFPIDKWPKF